METPAVAKARLSEIFMLEIEMYAQSALLEMFASVGVLSTQR